MIDVFREVAELHGFSGIETRAVEPLEQMLRKGEIDKEVYVLRRLHAEDDADGESSDPSRTLGLHFDLTVPLARYVLEHQNDLAFPLRRGVTWHRSRSALGPDDLLHGRYAVLRKGKRAYAVVVAPPA